MSDYKPLPNESWVQCLRRERKFADLMLMVWSLMEDYLDQVVANPFSPTSKDENTKKLLGMSVSKKLDFLKESGKITIDEFDILKGFTKYRNELFHGEHLHYFILSEPEKDKIMDNVVVVANLLSKILFRKGSQ